MSKPTVKISKDQHVWAFKADMQPVVTVDPGTVIEKETANFSGTIVFVTHGGTVRSVLGSILNLPISKWGVIGGLSNACWSVLELTKHHTGSKWYLAEHNAGSLPEPVFGDDAVN